MEQRVSTYSQYSISSNVNGIKNIESQTLNGISVQKIYFQPDVNLDLAIAQIVSATNAIRALMPPGIQPPIIVQFNASSVPVLQLSLTSDSLNEQQLYDYGIYQPAPATRAVHGVTFPTPAGGKYRQIMVDLDPAKLLARGLTPKDVVNAVNAQNLTLPSGQARSANTQYTVRTNATPGRSPSSTTSRSRSSTARPIFMQGRRPGARRLRPCSRTSCARTASAPCCSASSRTATPPRSTWSNGVRSARCTRPRRGAARPKHHGAVRSVGVRQGRRASVVREGAIAAGLTALMILLFLGSWRSTLSS